MSRRAPATLALGPLIAAVSYPVGVLLGGLAALMLGAGGVGLIMGAVDGASHMGVSAAITAGLAGAALVLGRSRERGRLNKREAILVVTVSWVAVSLTGGLPFLIGADFTVAEAVFESTSGFTTTGATILPEIAARLDPALHFWRMLSHWLGGIGIVVLFVAIFPTLGVGGKHLFRSEVAGPRAKGLAPRIRQTSTTLLMVYGALTALEALLLWVVAGLTPFEAITHALSTLGTGGFSTLNGSVGEMENVAAEWIIVAFMIIAGMNFSLFHEAVNPIRHAFNRSGRAAALQGARVRDALQNAPRVFLRHTETRVYAALLLGAALACALVIFPLKTAAGARGLAAVHEAGRDALFQVAAIASTTGFGTDDFEQWPTFAKMVLLALFFTGGCSGSTAGGMKLIRVIILIKAAGAELRRTYRPQLVYPVRVGRQVITQGALVEILAFAGLFAVTCAVGAAAVALFDGVDGTTALTASLACVANVGPGFGMVGPTDNFGLFSPLSLYTLSACMLLGRLEFLTVLAIFTRPFWRR
jgi:trk system potassium uptake protein TrkH